MPEAKQWWKRQLVLLALRAAQEESRFEMKEEWNSSPQIIVVVLPHIVVVIVFLIPIVFPIVLWQTKAPIGGRRIPCLGTHRFGCSLSAVQKRCQPGHPALIVSSAVVLRNVLGWPLHPSKLFSLQLEIRGSTAFPSCRPYIFLLDDALPLCSSGGLPTNQGPS